IPTKNMLQIKRLIKPMLIGILLSYVIVGSIMIILTNFLISDDSLRIGMMLVAATPPGVTVIPFAVLLSGNIDFALFALFGTYIASLLITPLLTILLTSAQTFPLSGLLYNLIYLIVLPIIFSRLLHIKKISPYIEKWQSTIINWGFSLVVLTVIGLNQKSFFNDFNNLYRISLIAFSTSFPLFYIFKYFFNKINVKPDDSISMILISTIKNPIFASTLAMDLFDDSAISIPGAIVCACYSIYMLWLGKHKSHS
ncbi:MAG: hypothetical protein WCY14_01995, partial [Arcobacteraceae bacterium]